MELHRARPAWQSLCVGAWREGRVYPRVPSILLTNTLPANSWRTPATTPSSSISRRPGRGSSSCGRRVSIEIRVHGSWIYEAGMPRPRPDRRLHGRRRGRARARRGRPRFSAISTYAGGFWPDSRAPGWSVMTAIATAPWSSVTVTAGLAGKSRHGRVRPSMPAWVAPSIGADRRRRSPRSPPRRNSRSITGRGEHA